MNALSLNYGNLHSVRRSNLYEDVIKLYDTELLTVLNEFPFHSKFEDECAVDIGGVTRDMFSAMFEEIYKKHFDGASLLVPMDIPNAEAPPFSALSAIFSHAYMITGMLPVKVAFPILAAILLPKSTTLPDSVLLESFVDSLSSHDTIVCQEAIKLASNDRKAFPPNIQAGLITILSRYGVCRIPKPDTLTQLLINVAQHQFFRKPAFFNSAMQSAVPEQHRPFWSDISSKELYRIYKAQQASISKVLAMLEDPETSNPNEDRVFGYLQQFVGSLAEDTVRQFLRFVTGSAVCTSTPITVTFNNLEGLARRPISHTCVNSLELSVSYPSYVEFKTEFLAILGDNDEVWQMLAI